MLTIIIAVAARLFVGRVVVAAAPSHSHVRGRWPKAEPPGASWLS
jgi:hypothetical protein